MKAKEIEVGRKYVAKVDGTLTTVRVDSIVEYNGTVTRATGTRSPRRQRRFNVTNLRDGKRTTFYSAQNFRSLCLIGVANNEQSEVE